MSVPERQIEWLVLDDLQPDPANPKLHDIDTLRQSYGRFGVVEPIVVDGRTGFIVSGHGRVESLKALRDDNHPAPDGVRADESVWSVPVLTGWSSTDDNEAHAALIALNRTTERGGWDERELLRVLSSLDGSLDGVGFMDDDLISIQEAILTSEQRDFLEEIAGEKSTNPFRSPLERPEDVQLAFAMSPEQRHEVLRVLRTTMKQHSLETLTDALIWRLNLGGAAEPGGVKDEGGEEQPEAA